MKRKADGKRADEREAKAMVVLNSRDLNQMFKDGGCGYWKAGAASVLACKYVVSTYNSRRKTIDGLAHGAAYMIGEIAGVVPNEDRIVVKVSRFCSINVEDVWNAGGSNPVHYIPVSELGIDLRKLEGKWQAWPEMGDSEPKKGLSIQEAKLALAASLGVTPEQVEISIRV